MLLRNIIIALNMTEEKIRNGILLLEKGYEENKIKNN
jgi:hypothetical protein